jgi:hypothetical protein
VPLEQKSPVVQALLSLQVAVLSIGYTQVGVPPTAKQEAPVAVWQALGVVQVAA